MWSRVVVIWVLLLLLCVLPFLDARPDDVIMRMRSALPAFKAEAIVDVGANVGKWATFVKESYAKAKMLMIEADKQHEAKLDSVKRKFAGDIEYEIAVLSGSNNQTVEFWSAGDTGNSIYRERSEVYDGDKPVSLRTQTLDDLVASSHLKDMTIDILKVDVQGAELEVLWGGLKTLQQATFVQIEASFVELNEGGACYWEVEELLRVSLQALPRLL